MSSQIVEQKPCSYVETDEESQITKINFNFKPIVFLMALSGCYNLQCNKKGVQVAYWIYKTTIILIVILSAVRGILMLKDKSVLFIYITLILLCCMCVNNCLISCKAFSMKYGHYHQAIEDLDHLVAIAVENEIEFDMTNYRRKYIFIISKATILSVVCFVMQGVSYFVLSPSPESAVQSNNSLLFTAPFEDTIETRVLLFTTWIIMTLPFTIPASFLILISILLVTVFNGLNNRIVASSKDDQLAFLSKLATFRQIHIKLCAIVSDLEKDLGYFYASIFLWIIGIGLIELYILLKFSQDAVTLFTLIFFFTLTMFILAIVAISAAFVNAAAHAPLDVIYHVDVKDANLDQVTQLNLFLSKLTGTQVGFTTCGLLTITKEFILTIVGVFLTYFAVLYTL